MAVRSTRRERGGARIDPRLVIGVALVAGSALGVWALIEALDDTTDVVVASETLTPGSRIGADDLRVESVRLGAVAAGYMRPADVPDGGLVVVRTVRAGELVPSASVAEHDTAGLATVVIPGRGALAGEVAPGALVDVWAAAEPERGAIEPPAVLVSGAEVAAVVEADGMMSSSAPSVELLIPREKTAAVLEALAAGDVIDLVPARPAGDD
ncbi:Flp pilus assembly protein CpaB [Agromyces flavus]|uniref:Chaperone for flagella basal body P-ring formation n=1 Tax=Agromyces flavus TaxID=589382 RepID=A0A1H1U9Y3_9MICO|nr:SAF domain-containing protein [Agromyces flavus]MCP2368257.1 Flp pilus assembly protein CpaB [Agromyces flavus]GGI47717.1 flagellar protein FlgA [Agromyces flavus]SDS69322.1 Chaperone for flagella basal body P-ring formation [Agromyces flavus]